MRYQNDLSEKEINENIEGTIEQYTSDTFFTQFFCKNLNSDKLFYHPDMTNYTQIGSPCRVKSKFVVLNFF